MASRSGSRKPASPFPQRRTPTPEEWVLTLWPEASPRKHDILVKRHQDLWGALDESVRAQMNPSQAKDRKPPRPKNAETNDMKFPSLGLSHVDLLTGSEFEKFIGEAFERKGYTVEYHGGPTES